MCDLTILVDYRGAFYSSTKNVRTLCSMDVARLQSRFSERGWNAKVVEFPDVDHREEWQRRVVLYQSAEDPGLEYKSYIEDVVLGLSLAGAHLVPGFPYLRAHHNKVFMAILQRASGIPEANTLSTKCFGTYEDFRERAVDYPVVAKTASGAGSKGVALLHDENSAVRILRRMSRCRPSIRTIRELSKRLIRKDYVAYSLRPRKFLLQEFIPSLTHDYKVLVYGDRVFVVRREVRNNDFRASGSGKVSWPRELPPGLLDFAWKLFQGFDVPHASFDIADCQGQLHLLEMQFVQFGPLTLEGSDFHWRRHDDEWTLVESQVELERTLVNGVTAYATKKGWFSSTDEIKEGAERS
ncbi:MAG: hypothetical protein GXX96_11165 [Planctomycetaceae bacterium]|nr:hypothetical protein [Planctomycetaceae bacterium]